MRHRLRGWNALCMRLLMHVPRLISHTRRSALRWRLLSDPAHRPLLLLSKLVLAVRTAHARLMRLLLLSVRWLLLRLNRVHGRGACSLHGHLLLLIRSGTYRHAHPARLLLLRGPAVHACILPVAGLLRWRSRRRGCHSLRAIPSLLSGIPLCHGILRNAALCIQCYSERCRGSSGRLLHTSRSRGVAIGLAWAVRERLRRSMTLSSTRSGTRRCLVGGSRSLLAVLCLSLLGIVASLLRWRTTWEACMTAWSWRG